ncbi:MAG: glycosyltransferase family 1 protein, partial [Clostridia bacterium]
MEKPIRILFAIGSIMNYGGIETFIMNYYRKMDHSKVQIDFLANGSNKGAYDEEIEAMGGRIYHLPRRGRHYFAYRKAMKEILKSGEYQIIHAHANEMNGLILSIAKKCEIPVRISHCHTANPIYQNKIIKIIYGHYKKKILKNATHFFACSDQAAKWMYGEQNVMQNKVTIVKNAIDIEKYKFNTKKREELRNLYQLEENTVVIGHIGRFYYEKNHSFIVELFEKYHQLNPNSKLFLIGEGALKNEIIQRLKEKKLAKDMITIDRTNQINELLNIFDIFILPSLFEGLPFVGIEAQANGLPCFFSKGVTNQIQIANNLSFIELDSQKWAKEINSCKKRRQNNEENLTKAGYNINLEVKKLEEFYQSV